MHFFLFNIYPAAKTYPAAAKKGGELPAAFPQNAEQLVQEALQAAQAHKREAERQAGVKAQQILSRAREQAEEIQRGAEAEAGRLADALRERADARGAEAIDAVKRLLFA